MGGSSIGFGPCHTGIWGSECVRSPSSVAVEILSEIQCMCNLVTIMTSKLGILVFAAQFLISRCAGIDNELVQRDTTNVTIAAPLVIPPSEYLWVYPWVPELCPVY